MRTLAELAIRRTVKEVPSSKPYSSTEFIEIEIVTSRIPKAERTLTRNQRRSLREANRIGERDGNPAIGVRLNGR